MKNYINDLEKLLKCSLRKQKNLIILHKGNEKSLTYWAGHDKGYWDGRITILEDIIDDLKEIYNNENTKM